MSEDLQVNVGAASHLKTDLLLWSVLNKHAI